MQAAVCGLWFAGAFKVSLQQKIVGKNHNDSGVDAEFGRGEIAQAVPHLCARHCGSAANCFLHPL